MLDINFDEKINELNSEIESLRMALAKADERKTNFQSAKGLISEITGDIREKLELLAQWLPADALTTAVRVIIREVESCESEILPVLPPLDDLDDIDDSDDDRPDGGYSVDDNPPLPGDDGGQAEEILEQAKEAAEYFAVETFHQEEYQEETADEQEQLELGLPSENESASEGEKLEKSDDRWDDGNALNQPVTEIPEIEKAAEWKIGDRVQVSLAHSSAFGKKGVIVDLCLLADGQNGKALVQLDTPLTIANVDCFEKPYWWNLKELELELPIELPIKSEVESSEESEKIPEKIHDIAGQINNSFTPLENFGDFISYRQVPGEPGFICYLSANNKERLERWQHFLVVTHSFADCSEIFTPKDDKEARTFKGKHCLKLHHLSSEALLWIRENYDAKSAMVTYHDVPEWKRPPIELSKPYVPNWYVRVDGDVAFTGSEAEARETYAQLIKANSEDQKNWSIALLDNDYVKIDGWFKGEALPVPVPVAQEIDQEIDQELEVAIPF